jgi:hypothetical protein
VINQWIAEPTQQQRSAERTIRELGAIGSREQAIDPAQVRALLEELGDPDRSVGLGRPAATGAALPGDGDHRRLPARSARRDDQRRP